jgi:GTPase SAR1 family protein
LLFRPAKSPSGQSQDPITKGDSPSSILILYLRSIGVILCFDLTKKESFYNIQKWQNEVLECTHENIEIMLVGNKLDLEEEYYMINPLNVRR